MIQSKQVEKQDAFDKLKQLEAEHGPIDGFVSTGGLLHKYAPIGQEFVDCFPQLRFLTGGGAGYNNIDTEALSKNGVYYCNTPQAVAEPTADCASTMILCVLRNFISYDRNTRKGKWKEGLAQGTNPRDATIGILGMGSIGGIVARHMQAFGAKVVYHNRNKLPEKSEHGAKYVAELSDFLAQCDVVSVHVPLSASTRHYLSTKEFKMMKEGSKLVNTARGPVVDEEALVAALKSGHLAGAALDVFENEPEIHPWLLEADNVLLLPHNGSNTRGTDAAVVREMVKNLDSYLSVPKGEPPHNAVNKLEQSRKVQITVRLRGMQA
ncbi:D-3-phosphoglycerate dehydrogenase [Cystobasidium minutum MCA 4210]|uniref:D-3-phosphoglycerate dehydrogenase n=1 Tax=Cystobasidium minutum MCA 4210 TaxID=1397322 RepID=UPI0034CE95B2|eukprot:jgi/Rhomi1/180482/fgenesh1_pg.4_\